MQIRDIVLYSKTGQRRILPLRVGGITIITGSSGTGKSALIDIVDYCLGRGSCNIPVGPIRNAVDWYALRLQFPFSQVFIARKSPSNRQSTNVAFLLESREIEIPDVIPEQNTTIEAVETHINSRLGISPNLHTPPVGQTRSPLAANFRHALLFCFQTQNNLTSRDELFHRQNENNGQMNFAIKDTLPYFLGAVREDALSQEYELNQAKRELKVAQRELENAEAIQGEGISNAVRLVSQAIQVGLLEDIEEMPSNLDELLQLLQQAAQWNPPDNLLFFDTENPNLSRLERLQHQVIDLQDQNRQKQNEILAAETYAQEASGYEFAARQQELRLESVGLFDRLLQNNPHNSATCPLCSQQISNPIPSVDAICNSLQKIKRDLALVNRDRPQLREYIERLQEEQQGIQRRLQITFQEIEGILREQEEAEQWRQQILARSRAVGRISLWLENAVFSDETFELESKVRLAETKIQEIQSLLNPEERQDQLSLALNRISLQMTQWAAQLQLEHADGYTPVHLNLNQATVIIDSPNSRIPLNLIGAGKNVEGYHLVTHLSLHKYFVDKNRPTPRFLFLDQPSQVYFLNSSDPSIRTQRDENIKATGSIEDLDDQEQESVKRLFNFIFDVFYQSLTPNFQIIITEHANLFENQRFQDAIVEIWRGDRKLVPLEWLNT